LLEVCYIKSYKRARKPKPKEPFKV